MLVTSSLLWLIVNLVVQQEKDERTFVTRASAVNDDVQSAVDDAHEFFRSSILEDL